VIEADFSGGDRSSEGGVLLLRRMDQRLELTAAAAAALGDARPTGKVQHSLASMVAQHVYGLCPGWADVCDHNALRADLRCRLRHRRPAPGRPLATHPVPGLRVDPKTARIPRRGRGLCVLIALIGLPARLNRANEPEPCPRTSQ
jgi:hypothetical protein